MNRNSSPYHDAGWLLNEHLQKRRGIKSIAFDTQGTGKDGKRKKAPEKATYATVCKTMQHLSTINEVLNANNKKLRKGIGFDTVRNKGLLYIMLYELLFGKYKSIRGGGKIKRMIVKHEKELRREAEDYSAKHGGVENGPGGGKAVSFPRYIRVNTLRVKTSDIVSKLKEDLSSKMDGTDSASPDTGGDDKKEEQSMSIYADAHVPDLLVLPPTASSRLHYDYDSVKDGNIVLQDKSSCFSALALAHGLGERAEDKNSEPFDYIDACAAPGNKTSHLAALVLSSFGDASQPKKKKKGKKNTPKSTIFAFERSSSRFNILQERMNQLVPSVSENGNTVAVVPTHADFLKADPSDPTFANVRAIMLDPSCSGSGIVNSPDRWMEDGENGKDKKRILSLSNFQLVALKHAMSFPNVDRVVYSTCSVHAEENEAVVSKALSELDQSGDENDWELISPVCLEHWPRRGKEGGIGGLTKSQADCLVRCDGLDGDETNGFFVAFFVRKKLSSNAEHSRKAIDNSTGIPIYSGEFATTASGSGKDSSECTLAIDCEKVAPEDSSGQPQLSKSKTQQIDVKKKDLPSNKTSNKVAKKREKKLAWKRKQALQKCQRLKKKEETTKEAPNDSK